MFSKKSFSTKNVFYQKYFPTSPRLVLSESRWGPRQVRLGLSQVPGEFQRGLSRVLVGSVDLRMRYSNSETVNHLPKIKEEYNFRSKEKYFLFDYYFTS
jgi:hypothetical protein